MSSFQKNISFSRVYGNVIILLAISLFSLLAIAAGSYTVQRETRTLEQLTANQETRIELNDLLQKKLLQIKAELQTMSLSRSHKERILHYTKGSKLLEETHALLDVLENGGDFTHTYLVNFGNEEEISHTLYYRNDFRGILQLEIIELNSRLKELQDHFQELNRLIVLQKKSGQEKVEQKLFFFSKGLQPFFDRILENANRIYFESHQHLTRICQARDSVSQKNRRVVFAVTLSSVLLLFVVGILLARDIRQILKERENNFVLIQEYNENLEKKVLKRTHDLEEVNQGLEYEILERKKAEKTILEQKGFLSNAIEALSHPFYVINVENYSVLLHNSSAGKMGTSEHLTCHQLTHHQAEPCRSNEHPCPLQEVVRTGKPCIVEHVHFDQQGKDLFVEVHGYPIFDEHGKVIRMIEYSLDITARKKAEIALQKINEELEFRVAERTRELAEEVAVRKKTEQELRKLSRAVEQSSNTIVVTDVKGDIEYVNQAFSRITGYTVEEVIGQNPSIIASSQTPDHVYSEMWKTILAGETWTGEFVNKKKNGELFEESIIISPIRDEHDNITNFIAIKEDISELKRAWKMSEEANRAKSQFLANMSHEIRTPMNAIIGMSGLALDSHPEPQMRYFLETIQHSSGNLLQLINDILDFSKIEAGQLELENQPFNLLQTVEAAVQTIGLLAEEKGLLLEVTVDSDIPENLSGDSLRLGQILLNIRNYSGRFVTEAVTTGGGGASVVLKQMQQAGRGCL